MSAPRILFGLGATKAGSSWLHEWLSDHPSCHFRRVKELHYFDALDEGRTSAQADAFEALCTTARSASRRRDLAEAAALLRGGEDAEAYLRYLSGHRGHAEVVGDITPAYGLLSAERLRAMAGLGDTRFLYILRDPVDRLWSHVRMIAGRREPSGAVTRDRCARILQRVFDGKEDQIVRRGDYAAILGRLVSAVPASRRLAVFFEDLFSGDAAARICAFLGISAQPALARAVHVGQPLTMTADQARTARRFLADQYAFVQRNMGPLPSAWRHDERV